MSSADHSDKKLGKNFYFTELSLKEKLMMKLGIKSKQYWLMLEYERLDQACKTCKKLIDSNDYRDHIKELLEEFLDINQQRMIEIKRACQ